MKLFITTIITLFAFNVWAAPQDLKDAINTSAAKNGGIAKLTADIRADLRTRLEAPFDKNELKEFKLFMETTQCHETDSLWPVDKTAERKYYGVCFVNGGQMMIGAKYAIMVSESKIVGFQFIDLVIE